jgi:PAS domain S-box-containing protein
MIDDKIRKTGIDIIGDISWGTHICLFYQTTNDLIDILVPYFKAGLENNELCMWITSDPLNAVDAKRSLERVVKNLDEYLQKGQIEILDYRQWYIQSGEFNAGRVLRGWVEKERQAVQSGWDGLRLTGNTFWLDKGDWKEFIEYERMVDHVIDEYRMIAICTYFLDKCGASEVIDVVSNHQSALVKRGGRWEIIQSAERKRAEETLRYQATLLNNLKDAVIASDEQYRITAWNPAAELIYGWKTEEVLGRFGLDITQTEFPGVDKEAMLRSIAELGQWRGEVTQVRKDGSRFPVEISSIVLRDENGRITGYVSLNRDITERKQSEEALVQEQCLQSALMDNLPDHIYFKDTESRFTRINKATTEWLGLADPAEALGKTDFNFFLEDHARSAYEDEQRIIRTGQALVNKEEREKWSDRPDTWVSTTKLPLRDKEGRIIGTFGVSRDITERKRAEQGLKLQSQVLENMVEGVNVSDENDIIIFNNPAFEIMFGHAPGELIGQHVSLLLNGSPEENLRRVSEIIAQLRTKGTWLGEISNRKKDGISFTTYARISTLELSGNKYWISVQEDITERKRVEEAEREQHALAEALCDTAVALNSTLHLDDVLDRILTNVGRVVPFDAVNIMLVESGIARIIRHQGYKEHGLEGFVDQVRFDLGDLAGLHYMTETKRPIVIPDTQTFTQWVDIPELRWIRSYVSSPICIKGETVGFLNLDSTTPGFFTPVHAKRLESFAAQAAIAIENAQLYEQIEVRHRYLGTLLRINATLRSTLPPNIVLETISRSAGEALGYVGSLITVPDGNNERLILGSIWGSHLLEAAVRFTGLKVESFSLPIAAEGNPIIRAFQSGEIQLQSGEPERIIVGIEPSINPKLAILIGQAMGAKLAACVPLLVDGEAVGVLIVFSPRERLSDEERAMLLGMADQAGLAITNARTFEEVRAGRERLQNLSHQLVEAQESERRHIARELHDEIGQVLTFLKLSLEMSARLPPDAIRVNLEKAKEMVSELLTRVRILSHDLRPAMLDDLGLLPALLWLFERYTAQTQVQVDFKHASQERLRFSPDIETAAYRIVQEALTNVARHANMSQAIVRLWTDQDRLNVQIEDHGIGFDPVAVMHSGGSSGLIGMSERVSSLGGQLRVESSPGTGTCIIAELPLG